MTRRGRIFLSIIILFCSFACCSQTNANGEPPVSMDSLFKIKERESIGKAYQDFNINFDGGNISKNSLRGKIVFINFWFEACPPCIAELPALNDLYQKYSANENFEFLSFTYESPERIKLLKQKYKINYKVASVSRQECYRLNQNNGFPTSIVLDKEGIIKNLFTGGDENSIEAGNFIVKTVYKSIAEGLSGP